MDDGFFRFDGAELLRVLISAPIIYVAIITFVRLAGKRSTSQMNNFDWVVTVALGSLAASGILATGVSIFESLLAIATLLALQWGVTRLIVGNRRFSRLVKAEPALLVDDGAFLPAAMIRERVSEDEVLAAVRDSGFATLDDVRWVVLETDATLSVLGRVEGARATSALTGVTGFPST